jgi:hypothetical protein
LLATRPSIIDHRSSIIDAWVEKALAIDREQRFPSVRALWSAFLDVAAKRPTR